MTDGLASALGVEVIAYQDAEGLSCAVLVVEPGPHFRWSLARSKLARRGRVLVLAQPHGAIALLPAMSRAGLEPKRLIPFYQEPARAAHAVLVVASCAKPGGLVVEPPVERSA